VSPKYPREKHPSLNFIDGAVRRKIQNFPSVSDVKKSLYSGKCKKYLNATLNIKILYSTFTSQNPTIRVSYDF
jgi:hypothetical protein